MSQARETDSISPTPVLDFVIMAATSLGAEMTAVGLQNNLSYSKSDTKNREFYFVFLSPCTTFAIKITRF